MRFPTGPWVLNLEFALARTTRPAVLNEHSTTSFVVRDGRHEEFVQGLADLVMFLWQGVVDLSSVPSWDAEEAVRMSSWRRLLFIDGAGDYVALKPVIGEALAWWHEETTPEVAFAGRPAPEVNQPVIDSVSLLLCEANHVIRAVQAKAGYGRSRPRFREATLKYRRLAAGDFDSSWNDRMYAFRLELQASGWADIPTAASLASSLQHFGVLLASARVSASDPAHDFPTEIDAHPPDGRAVMLLENEGLRATVEQVAERIRNAKLP